jgi:3-hexulose-6-phosphate synthase
MKIQVSIDLLSLDRAMNLLQEVAVYIDVIEAGTPLIKQEGLKVVETFKQHFPDKLIFADMKTMDAGELEAEMAFKAGADFTTILAVANDATISGALAAARKYNKTVCVDLIGVPDRVSRAQALEKLGVSFVELHSGLDEQALGRSGLSELQSFSNSVKIPFSVAGGINENTILQVEAAGANTVAIGAAIYASSSPGEVARRLRDKIATVSSVS